MYGTAERVSLAQIERVMAGASPHEVCAQSHTPLHVANVVGLRQPATSLSWYDPTRQRLRSSSLVASMPRLVRHAPCFGERLYFGISSKGTEIANTLSGILVRVDDRSPLDTGTGQVSATQTFDGYSCLHSSVLVSNVNQIAVRLSDRSASCFPPFPHPNVPTLGDRAFKTSTFAVIANLF